ncbi:Protein of unknown function DUF267, Caenorhabditis species family-containing protein [Strongyloides ratti]|uniref:Uncharacterized protein n=1 Tax=Strongyloides ratti TaxID=34506 RepID=A0A090LP55_STRRB|nr:Protein of unknown function DUF267, Caenorhabditis species family-containing protein [Strongyloides ratti]CEF69979.1 Protein of unknown function DUF267, Caenorhabditis species family-containing protein [Strongyloides ratti]
MNFINYDKNVDAHKRYKQSIIHGKSTFIVDVLVMLYAKTVILLFVSIYTCIYNALNYEAEVFYEECNYILNKDFKEITEKLNIISIKHAKLYKVISFSHQTIGTWTNFAILNSTIMIIFGISVFRYYKSNTSNIFDMLQILFPIICLIYLELIILKPICSMDKHLKNIKNTILNIPYIWNKENYQLHGTALSIATRSDHCEYHGLFMNLIPFNDKTISILTLSIIIISLLLGEAVL